MKRKILLLLFGLIFALTAAFAGYKVVTILTEYKAGEDAYESLQQYIHISTTEQTKTPSSSSGSNEAGQDAAISGAESQPELLWPEVDFEALQAVNSDIVAWIYIEGTSVNYPVVQGADNYYYLRRMTNREYNNAGSIFMDYRNHAGFSDSHTVLYGHNMENGTMFADIYNYQEQAYYDAHPVCQIMTPDGNYTLTFFTGYTAKVTDAAWEMDFPTGEEYTAWLSESAARSCFASNVTPAASDRIVTLSTCSDAIDHTNTRFVLAGILKPAQ